MVASIVQIEARFNKRETHQYDWVFFNNEEFTEEFKEAVSKATYSRCYFERINEEHWGIPDFIDETRFDVGRQFMGSIGVGKAWLQSYHHMCRWNAGLFAMEQRLIDYDWFWRVEPGVQFYCDIKYDVFRFMQENNMSYGFNMAILDDARSFPSLWEHTKEFIDDNGELIHPNADFNWLLHDPKDHDETLRPATGVNYASSDGEYNNCQFYSNFEIGSLRFFRGEEHQAYFNHLDRAGGFYYERYGDAPVHTLSVNMFLPRTQIWYFRDIGYAHGLCEQCPPHENQLLLGSEPNSQGPRDVQQQANESEPKTVVIETLVTGPFESFGSKRRQWDEVSRDVKRQMGIPGLSCGCTTSAIDNNNAKLVPFESKQRKPSDPCIRKFLGGRWLVRKNKMSDLNSDTGNTAGSDDVEYILDGRETNPIQ
ncbi:glycosyltransferase family 15 protein [Annulohypoxylon truncatum]|uniref:glycosyltransferase family 15 protein n=1 Tax=Annulohypoxylon truncatum TaxID=327061 RepID=UPI002008039D|nr:glycosyltransferase family 15 protein [Annulohypoxylon truncatum]KAI1205495.1 glycosyltransferase family 15 protein [Annulohypoxylon truncatum]